uniref:malectin domain-containing carbohydrate-binding protein n=1 Tax=Paractinoplanes polyasparticus TaxID=2856853 RepID=UPI001C8594CE|nr:malectin domain-containing carbohydrate-binding protein [Actinoplanes polyasparticus]
MGFRTRVIATAAAVTLGAALAAAPAQAAEPVVTIDAGGPGDISTDGLTDVNRSGFTGVPNFARTVSHPIPQEDWDTFRYLDSDYTITGLTPGASYELRLYFLDWYWSKVGKRVFDVAVNGQTALKDVDVIKIASDAGGDGRYFGVERDVPATADAAGAIVVNFLRGTADQPLINSIAVVPAGS